MIVSRPSWSGAAVRAFVGLVLIAIVAAVVTWERRATPKPAADAPTANEPLVLHLSAPDSLGSVVALAWTPDPRADEYEVEVLDSALTVLATLGPVKSPELALERALVPGVHAGTTVWCRVVALRGGERLAESAKLATALR